MQTLIKKKLIFALKGCNVDTICFLVMTSFDSLVLSIGMSALAFHDIFTACTLGNIFMLKLTINRRHVARYELQLPLRVTSLIAIRQILDIMLLALLDHNILV